ncbi:LysR family transcriptional regulator [Halocynthiibacter namhaensis]|uniref:LysR family transcriptional regulator n=1 Tax=Halocynthiibacter namhaensis TaxID=1290553 RepID=UPI000A6EB918|nr:LysR family transcriptional regulator [Halocynthiibacter namhaensis]
MSDIPALPPNALRDLPNLTWLRAFEASARLQSFTAAADELSLTQAAVSHQVRSLEKSFGVTLFSRGPRRLALTELGHAWYPTVAQALQDIALSTRGLLGPQRTRAPLRTITLRAPISTAVLCIAPHLGAFHAQNPDISVRLISAIWADSTQDNDVDVDVRLGPDGSLSRRAHLLSRETIRPVASPSLARQLPDLKSVLTQNLIHIHGYQDHWLRLTRQEGLNLPDQHAPLFVDTSLAAIELAVAGAGVTMIMKRYAEPHLSSARLVPLPGPELPMEQGHYLMPPEGPALQSAEVNLLRDWVVQLFARQTD